MKKYDVNPELLNAQGPLVYELYPDETRAKLAGFLKECLDEEIIVIPWDGEQDTFLIKKCLTETYRHFQLEAPNVIEQAERIFSNFIKAGLGVAGLLAQGEVSILLSYLNAYITINELDKGEPDSYKDRTFNALRLYKKASENLSSPELMLLSAVMLLLQISSEHKILLHIKNPDKLSLLDIQFLRTLYSLFKDKIARKDLFELVGLLLFEDLVIMTRPLSFRKRLWTNA